MRSHYCGDLRASHDGETVRLCGWVHRRRDHGGVIFLDLRDRTGLVQVVFDPDTEEAFALADKVRGEYVLQLEGRVRLRDESVRNPRMDTGDIEVLGLSLTILNEAQTPPFELDEYSAAGEEVRLKYRYLDLRRPEALKRFQFRSRLTHAVRAHLEGQGFMDVETPILTRATPEGARDYLVPSRTHPGSFFALPQSPQLFKQLLMVAGFDRYYQIAKCFRDEDLRADRQPEFTQIDLEASFVEEDDIMAITESMVKSVFKDMLDVDLPAFPRMTYEEAMRRYGSDKPDLRVPLELIDIADLMDGVEFKVFAGPAKDPKGRVVAMKVPGGGDLSRKEIDEYTKFVGIYGAKGLAYIKVNDLDAGAEGLQSPILKFLTEDAIQGILKRTEAATGDLIFFGADKAKGQRGDRRAARQGGPRARPGAGRLGTAVGGGLPHVRGRGRPLLRAAPSVHHAQVQSRGAQEQPGRRPVPGLRHGAQRHRTGRRLDPYSPPGHAAQRVRGAGHQRPGSGREIRLPAGRPQVRRAAARRPGVRSRPDGDADDRRRFHPRCDRLPENPDRRLPDDQRAVAGG